MEVLKNTFNNKKALQSKTVAQQIEILAQTFCDGMDYGYKIDSITKSDSGNYKVIAVCPQGTAASTQFIWHPESNTDYYVGQSTDGTTWQIHPALLKDFNANIVNV